MFENKIPWKKRAGICLFECFLELVNIVEKSQSPSKICRWKWADHTTGWEGWRCDPGHVPELQGLGVQRNHQDLYNILEVNEIFLKHATLTASVTFFSNQLKAQTTALNSMFSSSHI